MIFQIFNTGIVNKIYRVALELSLRPSKLILWLIPSGIN